MAATSTHVHSTWNATLRTILGAALAVTLVLLAFAWPTYTAKPKNMPLAVVGTTQQVDELRQQLAANGNAFTLTPVADRAAAVDAIEHRTAYGALVMSGKDAKTEVLTASAGSSAATQMLAQAAQKLAAGQMQAVATAKQQAATKAAELGAKAAAAQASAATLQQVGALSAQVSAAQQQAAAAGQQATAARTAVASIPTPQVTVTDVVPLTSKDSRGAGFAVAGLPLAMGGMIGGVMISLLVVGWKRRLTAVAGYGLLGGLGLALVLHSWFGFIPGSLLITWAVCGLAIAATAAVITGAQSLLGQPGIGLGAVLTMFVGNPLSGLTMPQEWLPGHWGEVGQFFVPGAAGTLLRLTSYFPHASQWSHWLALACWLAAGVVLTLLGHHRFDEVIHINGATEDDVVRPRHAEVTTA